MIRKQRDNGCIDVGIDPKSLRFVPHRRIRTKEAAQNAERIARWALSRCESEQVPDEHALFLALHTCAYRAGRRAWRRPILTSERAEWVQRWQIVRSHIVERNLGLVYSMITRLGLKGVERDELRSEGLFALMRAVDGFDPWCGFRFSTYACHAITRSLLQVARKARRDRARMLIEYEPWFEEPVRVDAWTELYADRLNRALDQNLGELTDREADILGRRYPLDGALGLTLGEIGTRIGLSRERVRQIEKTALYKIRVVLEADPALQ
ncbi:MAG: sigma-70 family RNA polymerase sigma factor [Planctomycetes bacterium]|nr:sigma-70 family RNA polymerase sigma factor [Planctomycetota bacterium]